MTNFTLQEIEVLISQTNRIMEECDNGEGSKCWSLEDSLRLYATVCHQFCDQIREWANSIFSGKIPFESESEKLFKKELRRLIIKAEQKIILATAMEMPCYIIEGKAILERALREMYRFRDEWVTPKLAVSPSARQAHPLTDEIRKKLESLPPLPKDWKPFTVKSAD